MITSQRMSEGRDFYCDVLSRKVAVERVVETAAVLAFRHTQPSYPAHIVVVPKQHVASLLEADASQIAEILEVVKDVAERMLAEYGACRVETNLGRYQASEHLHWHVVSGEAPRVDADEGRPRSATAPPNDMTYDKLVRDRIPELIQRGGGQPKTRRLSNAEFGSALTQKLIEEAQEVADTTTVEELADVLEVIHALALLVGSSIEQVEVLRKARAAERGSFEERIHLESVSFGEND